MQMGVTWSMPEGVMGLQGLGLFAWFPGLLSMVGESEGWIGDVSSEAQSGLAWEDSVKLDSENLA